MRSWHWLSRVIAIFCLLLLACFVWPTPWRVETSYVDGVGWLVIRHNRLTGTMQIHAQGQWGYWRGSGKSQR